MRTIAVLLSLSVIATGCAEPRDAYAKVHSPPVQLIGSYRSSQAPEEILAPLRETKAKYTVRGEKGPAPPDRRPRFDFIVVELQDQQYCGQRGALKLTFFNDRLSSTTFYPADIQPCLAFLGHKPPNGLERGTLVAANTLFISSTDYKGRPYVELHDQRMNDEVDRWISRYS